MLFQQENSTGSVELNTLIGPQKETVVGAKLNIYNAVNVTIYVRIFGFGASMSSRIMTDPFTVDVFGDKLFESKSFAFIYAHNRTQTRHRQLAIGQRQPGDLMLFEDRQHISMTSIDHFPQTEFNYKRNDVYLSCVKFSFDVSEQWHRCDNFWLLIVFMFFIHILLSVADNHFSRKQFAHRSTQF